jgi:Tol biopolymer transport system component
MSPKTKKILIIIAFVIVVALLAFLLYFVFFRKPVEPEIEPPIEESPEETILPRLPVSREEWESMTISERIQQDLPIEEWPEEDFLAEKEIERQAQIISQEIDEIAQGGKTWVNPVVTEQVQWATGGRDSNKSIYYNPEDGHFYEVDYLGNKTLFSEQAFYEVQNVNWSPAKNRAILEYPDGFKIMYDFEKEKQYTLPNNWEDFSWDPEGERIVFKALSRYPENNWLSISNADSSQARPLEHLGNNADKVTVSWSPHNQVIAFSATGSPRGAWEQEMILLGQNNENFKSIIIDGRDFQPKWSPDGNRLVYSVYSSEYDFQPRLYLVDGNVGNPGANKKSLNLATWAHKCAFNKDGSFLYCAVPRDLPEGAGLVKELAERSRDDFYKINTETGKVSFLAEGAMGGYNVNNIYLSGDEKYLYFTDHSTSRLRYIQLK